MSELITMPSLGADMTEGKLLQWRIKVGDKITKGQIIADIETQKAAFEMESFKEGTVTSLTAAPMEVIPVGAAMAVIENTGLEVRQEATDLKVAMSAKPSSPSVSLPSAAWSSPTSASTNSIVDVRKAIAKAMSRSKKEIPHYYLKTQASMNRLLLALDQINEKRPPDSRIMLPALLTKMVSELLQKYPEFNGYYQNDQFEARADTNIGIVIALKKGGVIVPALLETQKKSLTDIGIQFNDLIDRARAGKLRSRELSEATFTITNLGDLGVEEVFGVIFPPQVAILGIGKIIPAPVVKNGHVEVGMIMTLTLSGDHRVTDGIRGSRFLQTLKTNLEGGIIHE